MISLICDNAIIVFRSVLVTTPRCQEKGWDFMSAKSRLKEEATTKESEATGEKGGQQPTARGNDTVFLAKSMTLREDQYLNITSLAAYNKLVRKKPDTVSGVVREALDHYLASVDESYKAFLQVALEKRDEAG